jgi:hypothetical protein
MQPAQLPAGVPVGASGRIPDRAGAGSEAAGTFSSWARARAGRRSCACPLPGGDQLGVPAGGLRPVTRPAADPLGARGIPERGHVGRGGRCHLALQALEAGLEVARCPAWPPRPGQAEPACEQSVVIGRLRQRRQRRYRWHAGRDCRGHGHSASSCEGRRARRFLDVAERNPSVEGGGNERVPQGVRPYRLDEPGTAGHPADDPRSTVPVQPLPVGREEDRPPPPARLWPGQSPAPCGGERDGDDLAALAGNDQSAVPPLYGEGFKC